MRHELKRLIPLRYRTLLMRNHLVEHPDDGGITAPDYGANAELVPR